MLEFRAQRQERRRQHVDVGEKRRVGIVVVAEDARHLFLRVQHARGNQHRPRQLRDQLGGHHVEIERTVVRALRHFGGALPDRARGTRRHVIAPAPVFRNQVQFRADVRFLDVLAGRRDQFIAVGQFQALERGDGGPEGRPVHVHVAEVHVPRPELRLADRGGFPLRRVLSRRIGQRIERRAPRALEIVERHARQRPLEENQQGPKSGQPMLHLLARNLRLHRHHPFCFLCLF